ncbi:diguanylate cyclase [Paraburkholderia bryophila]|uniref:sensor domain-containing diguanylate cyclase n=1 Tax=Paraburkholderia bryophila TaxID=420952 RepID=UPI00234A78EA|nr:diguanylate cyclase [Paraburkholderia bryophila]WCM22553.1 diguanylate cyclase [Paraburkholderia bryophila]
MINELVTPVGATVIRPRVSISGPRVLFAWAMVFALCMLAIFAAILGQARVDAFNHSAETSRNVAVLVERDIERNVELYNLSMQAVVDSLRDPEVRNSSVRLQRHALFDRLSTDRYLTEMVVIDATGRVVLDAASDTPRGGNFSGASFFTVHRESASVGLYFSRPYHSTVSDRSLSIALSRRISNPDGSFAGVVMMGIDLNYFRALLGGLSIGPHGSISLVSRDGIMIMRQPYSTPMIGLDISRAATINHFRTTSEGIFTASASVDGVRRQYIFRNFRNLPLIVMVAQAESDIYAQWSDWAIHMGLVMAAFCAVFVGVSAWLGMQQRERLRAEAELWMLARTDELTGLKNRRTLFESLDHEWRRARRTRNPLSLLFIDIDNFKAYNDTYGHQAGDDTLAAVARCIAGNVLRLGDCAGRYGGEEFVVVLPDTDEKGSVIVAEKIRACVSAMGMEHIASLYGHVTVSIGASTKIADQDTGSHAILQAADQALYQAKDAGRNRVAISGQRDIVCLRRRSG